MEIEGCERRKNAKAGRVKPKRRKEGKEKEKGRHCREFEGCARLRPDTTACIDLYA